MCELIGETVAQFGNGTMQITISGTLNVLKNNPYFSGNMTVNYQMPSYVLSGNVSANIKFPSNGWILQSDNVNVNFSVGNGQWSASGNNMGGSVLTKITLSNGNVN